MARRLEHGLALLPRARFLLVFRWVGGGKAVNDWALFEWVRGVARKSAGVDLGDKDLVKSRAEEEEEDVAVALEMFVWSDQPEVRKNSVRAFDGVELIIGGTRLRCDAHEKQSLEALRSSWESVFGCGLSDHSSSAPDTLVLKGLPSRWFAELSVSTQASVLVTRTVLSVFGQIRNLEIVNISSLQCNVWVQYEKFSGFLSAMEALCGCSMQKEGSSLKVSYLLEWDNSAFFSPNKIQLRKEELRRQQDEHKRKHRERSHHEERESDAKRSQASQGTPSMGSRNDGSDHCAKPRTVSVYTPGGRLLWTVAVPLDGVSAVDLVSSTVGWLRLDGRPVSSSEMIPSGTEIVYENAKDLGQVSVYHARGYEICKVEIPVSGKTVSNVLRAVGRSGRLIRNGARLGSEDLVFPGEQGLVFELKLASAGPHWVALKNVLLGSQPKMVAGDVFKPGNVLSVPPIPGMEEIHQGSLWVHPQYAAINAALGKLMAGRGTKRVHVIGTAGTGKSAFAMIKMYHLAQQGARVAYRPINETLWLYFDFSHGTVFRGRELEDFEDVIDNETWVVVDGASKPVLHTGPLLQCVSDSKEGHHEIGKRGAYLFMEAWSLDECKQCNIALGLGVSDLAAKYYYIGGVPRTLFNESKTPRALKLSVDMAISKLCRKGLDGFMDNVVGRGEKVSDALFHYNYAAGDDVRINPAVWEFKPASSYVELRVDEVQKVNTDERRKEWLLENIGNANAAVYRGWRFERYAHSKLRQGGSFHIKDLQTGTMTKADVQALASSAIYEWDLYGSSTTLVNIQGQARSTLATLRSKHYVQPVIKTQSSYDSFLVEELDTLGSRTRKYRVRMFQMCVGMVHPVKWDAVLELMQRLGELYGEVCFEFVFVVPKENMDTFMCQQFLVKDGSHVYQRVPADAKRLKQFALGIGFT